MSTSFNMELDLDDLSIDPLKVLWYGGLHPVLNPIKTTFFSIMNIILCFLFIALAIEGVWISYNNDLFFMAECLQTCILMIHVVIIILISNLKRINFLTLLDQKSQFWKLKDFKGPVYEECLKISQVVKKLFRFFYTLNCFVVLFFDMQPFTTGNLPTVCYVPPGWFKYLAVILWYLSVVTLMALPGTNTFFCSLATSLIIQFKLLRLKFNTAEFNKSNIKSGKELKYLVDYHNFLLSYCENLNITFRGVFLLKFILSIASGAVSVFIFMQPGAWVNRIKFLLYFATTTIESAFYCVPLEYVINLGSKIGKSLYESTWYNIRDNQLRKSITLILIRSQKMIIFSAYGLVWMNLRTFVLICKTVFSFYTYLNTAEKMRKNNFSK